MVLILYRIAAEVALGIARAGVPFWPARWRVAERVSSRNGSEGGTRETVWMHAASLGECKGLWALARALRDADDRARIVLTANTDAGLEYLRARIGSEANGAEASVRAEIAPLDHPRVVERFLTAHGVRALVIFEVELWPHQILTARRKGVPVFWVSARWNARARRRYGLFPGAARRVLQGVSWTQAQSEEEADALRRAGCARVETGADLRGLEYLEAADADDAAKPWSERNGIAFVSFHARELPALIPMLREAPSEAPLIVFPRKPAEFSAFVSALAPLGFVAHSQDPNATRRVVDRFGLVADTLRGVRGAVVGGSFAGAKVVGGHNLWEPLRAGCHVAIGPHHANQIWLADRMRAAGRLRALRDGRDGSAFLAECDGPPGNDSVVDEARATLRVAVRAVGMRISRPAEFP